ncbi:TPA: CDP-glycerol glycerophosphotransferase family protein [Escherichia coli]|nr:glycerophosphotransferase [Escherichia coli]EMV14633.1 Poly(glycerophosphate) glycerophosphotransferase family protein [Escherichia coli C-34666]EMX39363.1 Poly(glycerophosphate) glycerophosphotransferase family protein [Escherichia coli MP021552.8]ENA07087.1 Poly(glycerophosphate) glycerophosphotransferase family protein [Escherichia coli P0299917.1]ENC32930.1 Poly(glycerophosphate) glycerophosphotransferase family protein [Escherichia coli P02997067.6]
MRSDAINNFGMSYTKRKKLWVFGGWYGQRISDNPKYLLQYVNKYHAKNIRAVWIYKNANVKAEALKLGIEAYHYKSIKGKLIQLRAGLVLFTHTIHTDLNSKCISWNTKRIQMWHGIPLKKIGFDDNFTASKLKKSKLYRFTLNDINSYVLSSGNAVSKIFQSAFDESLGKMAETGFPRNDVFFNKQHQKISGKYNVLYMPTLRAGYGATFNLLDKRYDFQFEEIDSFLKEHDITLTLRIHPANNPDAKMVELIAASDSIKMSSSDDVYDEIGMYDCLITDYSSIMFDFALSHKPIIFAAFDIKDYLRDDRGMYFNYEDIASNNIAFSWQDVMFSLKENINVREHQDYKFLLQFHDDQNLLGKEHYYSRKVYEFLIEKLNIHVS